MAWSRIPETTEDCYCPVIWLCQFCIQASDNEFTFTSCRTNLARASPFFNQKPVREDHEGSCDDGKYGDCGGCG
ncbi:hypothetical protein HMPREF3214_01505 [Alloscardovia omnicolens]|nr:hypothetical protein HMPREF3214_01505 [Alloscardovia omnicolens]